MAEHKDVVIIGAGQAGLSISYYLTQMKREHVILEQAAAIAPAWRGRWESFTLVLPNWTVRMPGDGYQGEDPEGFMSREAFVAYMEDFAATFEPEIRFGWQVTSVEQHPEGGSYLVTASQGIIEADNVVVATGTFQTPRLPPFGRAINGHVAQLHSGDYVNPESLAEGAVLVVGTGQSGCQIAEELYQSGRKVYLCVGGAGRLPRRYRGKDSIWWLEKIGFFNVLATELPSPKARFGPNPFLSGKDGGHSLDLHRFARDGVVLLGHMKGAEGNTVSFVPDLRENLAKVDQSVVEFKQKVDAYIEEQGIEAEPAEAEPVLRDGYELPVTEAMDLAEEGITSIVWATGYKFDYGWIKLPLLDQYGYPIQERGVSAYLGLYFVGLNWLHRRKSGILLGVAEDAEYVAEAIGQR